MDINGIFALPQAHETFLPYTLHRELQADKQNYWYAN
jgi:hypothetical protein